MKTKSTATRGSFALLLILLVALAWGCGEDNNVTTSALEDQGPCPSEDSTVDCDSPPAVATFVPPPYPDSSLQAGCQGTVGLHVLVGKRGAVMDAIVRQSCGYHELNELAREFAWQNTYTTAKRNGRSICMWLVYHVRFDPANNPATVTLIP